jgi:metal-dependent amidase/aminoacylase/carboxypeptidase family protein
MPTRNVTASSIATQIDTAAQALEAQVIAWRRDLHAHPELGNREFRTAGIVKDHLRKPGPGRGAHRRGPHRRRGPAQRRPARPGGGPARRHGRPAGHRGSRPAVCVQGACEWNGEEVGVMHACGHDCHVAILMGVATGAGGLRAQLRGSVKFIFQPAEEMPPEGEDGGAEDDDPEGALEKPVPQAIFGLHVTSQLPTGVLGVPRRPHHGQLRPLSHHGAGPPDPWRRALDGGGPDRDRGPGGAGAADGGQSRNLNITQEPAVVTVGMIRGGVRENIIPDKVEMRGTIRSFNEDMRDDIHERMTTMAESIAKGSRAQCCVRIQKNYPVTINDPALTAAMRPTLQRVVGDPRVIEVPKVTGAEDFSYFQRIVPGLFFFVGVTPPEQDPTKAYANHSPRFYADEAGLLPGLRALAQVACDFLESRVE